MNLNKLKAEIERIKEQLRADVNVCFCRYVEIEVGVTPTPESLAIIEANERCRLHDRKHVGYSYIEISAINFPVKDKSPMN